MCISKYMFKSIIGFTDNNNCNFALTLITKTFYMMLHSFHENYPIRKQILCPTLHVPGPLTKISLEMSIKGLSPTSTIPATKFSCSSF